MARPLRLDYPGAFHHVTSRGNRRGDVFTCDGDRRLFMDALAATCRLYDWICHAHCLMTNHFHLLIESRRATLSAGMRQLNGGFTQSFNYRHGTVGHVFQGRFHSVLVEHDAHLLEVCRYVVLNPVRAGLAAVPENWRWSSYRATAGLVRAPEFLDINATLAMFSHDRRRAETLYRDFVAAGVGQKSPFAQAKDGMLGSEEFIDAAMIRAGVERGAISDETPRSTLLTCRPSLEMIFTYVTDTKSRDEAIITARECGYGLREIGAHTGIHYTTVSKVIHK